MYVLFEYVWSCELSISTNCCFNGVPVSVPSVGVVRVIVAIGVETVVGSMVGIAGVGVVESPVVGIVESGVWEVWVEVEAVESGVGDVGVGVGSGVDD